MAVALGWSGGKDSALALWTLRRAGTEPAALLTTVTEGVERISIHGVRRELLLRQAHELGIPLAEVRLPLPCPNEVYEQRMAEALATSPLDAIDTVAFGDLFLQDIRAYREERLAQATPPRQAIFPVWGQGTTALAQTFLDAGFEATVATVDPRVLDGSFAGRPYDRAFLADLPTTVDPCGENGEFHTFVHAGPVFAAPIPIRTGVVVERDGFVYADLLPDDAGAAGRAGAAA